MVNAFARNGRLVAFNETSFLFFSPIQTGRLTLLRALPLGVSASRKCQVRAPPFFRNFSLLFSHFLDLIEYFTLIVDNAIRNLSFILSSARLLANEKSFYVDAAITAFHFLSFLWWDDVNVN